MKQLKNLFYTGLLLMLVGCAKNIDIFIPYETTNPIVGDINTFFNSVRTDSYRSPWNNNISGWLITPTGTRFWIEAQSFQLPDGSVVSDSVVVEIKEIFSKGDMIKNQTPTTSNGRMLKSAGQFYLRVSQREQELSLLPNKSVIIQIPNANPLEEMELFYGQEVEDLGMNWIEADHDPHTWQNVRVSEWVDSLGVGFGYEMNVTQLQWLSCEAFLDGQTSLTETCIELPNIYTNKNTVVYMVFANINGIMPMIDRPDTQQFCQGNLPENEEVTYIVISHQGSDIEGQPLFHFAHTTTNVSNSMIEITPVEASLTAIMNVVNSL